ncbi:hypothetical protein L2E82_34269 [Cichorium intybus]|uniref:Uncharacterized protein n=1 Tax=Cichorium intybus TaxID=13427 RepID=A0ACB9BLV4_CICIN|nr:hypothetical protein L2E82_34269 [Cichorium intybus]
MLMPPSSIYRRMMVDKGKSMVGFLSTVHESTVKRATICKAKQEKLKGTHSASLACRSTAFGIYEYHNFTKSGYIVMKRFKIKLEHSGSAMFWPEKVWPHLQRTKLCDLKDEELDQNYVKKREQLKEVVASVIRRKIVQGKSINGNEFVSFLEKILDALNKGEIPSTGSLVEVFNKKILEKCLKLYEDTMSKVSLPISVDSLLSIHEASRAEYLKSFDEQHFGRHHAKNQLNNLMFKNFVMANQYQSSKLCKALYTTCKDKIDQLQVLRLPSMAKFNAGFLHCNQSFEKECVGPSKIIYEQRMVKVHSVWVAAEAYFAPSIVLTYHSPEGLHVFDDFREAYACLSHNTHIDDKEFRLHLGGTTVTKQPQWLTGQS